MVIKPSNYQDLVTLASDRSPNGRDELFRAVSDFLLDDTSQPGQTEKDLAASILQRLLDDVEIGLRRALSERLVARDDMPHDLVVELAMDVIEVAEPVLAGSPLLSESDLVEIIQNKTHSYQLAIARRRSISAIVGQALIDQGDADVITTLLGNSGAELTPEMLDHLVEESRWQPMFQAPLVERHELSEELAKRLYGWVAKSLCARICQRLDVAPEVIEAELAGAVDHALTDLADQRKRPSQLQETVAAHARRGELTIGFLVNALLQGHIELFQEGLASLTKLDKALVQRIVHDPVGRGLAVVCRALDADEAQFMSIFMHTRRVGDRPRRLKAVEAAAVNDLYNSVAPQAARDILRRWQERGGAAQAKS